MYRRSMSEIEKKAWSLYCEDTKGSMDVKDFWEDLSNNLQHKYIRKAKGWVTDVHTEHCCIHHGCKYGKDEECTVMTKKAPQSYDCEDCVEYEREPMNEAAAFRSIIKACGVLNWTISFKGKDEDDVRYMIIGEEESVDHILGELESIL